MMTSTQRIASLTLPILICATLRAGPQNTDAKKAPAPAQTAKEVASKTMDFAPVPVPERFLASCYSKGSVVIVGKDGKIEREIKGVGSAQDSWMLKNGNVLYSYIHGVREVDPQDKVVWEYKTAKPAQTEIHTVYPLPSGNVVIAESGQSRILEINRKGEIVKEIVVTTKEKSQHMQFRCCRKTVRGTYLIACFGDGVVLELNGEGKVLRALIPMQKDGKPMRGGAHSMVELPNGNLIIGTGYGQRFVEMDTKGEIIWTLSQADLPKDFRMRYACTVHQQSNGHRVIATYQGMPQFFAVTPDKKVVWSYNNKSLANISGVVILDGKGDPAKGEVLR